MIRPIYLYGSEVLRQKAAPADIENGKENIKGVGFGSVGDAEGFRRMRTGGSSGRESLRVAVVDGDVMADVFPYLKGFKRTFINPVVVSLSDSMCEYEEGCLSVPGIYASVRRPESIEVEYYDETFTKRQSLLTNSPAV